MLTIIVSSAQSVINGIGAERQEIALRNLVVEQQAFAQPETPVSSEPTAQDLNAIESAAGGINDSFPPQSFTNQTPDAL